MPLDAHRYKRRVELFLEKLEKNELIEKENIEILKKYTDYLVSENITYGRINKYLLELRRTAQLLDKHFKDATEEDIRRIVALMERNEAYSPWTKRDFRLAIRKFYTWLRGTKEYPPEVAWMRVHQKIKNSKTAEDMLTEEEVKQLVEHANTIQEKAFISTIYESGCRIGELIYLKINQVKFDTYGAQLFVTGKTGFRRVRIVSSVPYLLEWVNAHPYHDDPKAYFWLNRKLNPFWYSGITSMLYRIANRAGIKKRVNPHNFRHSRATYLANYLTEAQMKEYFGWQQDSKMAAVYVHLSGRDVDKALLKIYGIKMEDTKKESVFKPRECSRCCHINPATNRFCAKCGIPLDDETKAEILTKELERKEADKRLDKLLEDQEFREMFLRKFRELKA